MTDGEVGLGHPIADGLGFTSDRFFGYLWIVGEDLYVSFVEARHEGQGHFRAFVESALAQGYTVKVPTPLGRMEAILTKWGFRQTVEPSEVGPCEVWVKQGPLPQKDSG